MHLGDDPESAEAADLELGQIVARDVLDHLAARLHQPTVAGRDRAPEEVIAHRAEAVAQRACRRTRHDGAEGPFRTARRIEREPHALVRELPTKGLERGARLDRRDQIGRAHREDLVQARGC